MFRLYREYQKKEKIEEEDDDEEDEEEDNEDEITEENAFQKFQTVLQECPNQIVRTKFDMKVLWTSYKKEYFPKKIENDEELKDYEGGEVEIPNCNFCKGKRVPEVQILSTSVYFLQPEKNCHLKDNEGLDFGTAILYVCSKSCQKGAYVDEFVLVQPPFNQ